MTERELNLNDLTSVTMHLPEGVLKGENVDVYDTATGQQIENAIGVSIDIDANRTLAVITFQVPDADPKKPWREFTKTVDLVIKFVEAK